MEVLVTPVETVGIAAMLGVLSLRTSCYVLWHPYSIQKVNEGMRDDSVGFGGAFPTSEKGGEGNRKGNLQECWKSYRESTGIVGSCVDNRRNILSVNRLGCIFDEIQGGVS